MDIRFHIIMMLFIVNRPLEAVFYAFMSGFMAIQLPLDKNT